MTTLRWRYERAREEYVRAMRWMDDANHGRCGQSIAKYSLERFFETIERIIKALPPLEEKR